MIFTNSKCIIEHDVLSIVLVAEFAGLNLNLALWYLW